MQEATDRLMASFQKSAGITISYSRGTMIIAGITATVGRSPYNIMDGDVMIAYESRDYIIKKSDLQLAGLQFTPQSGDRITESDGGVYEVSIPKPLNVFESIGPDGTVFRIHTKGIG